MLKEKGKGNKVNAVNTVELIRTKVKQSIQDSKKFNMYRGGGNTIWDNQKVIELWKKVIIPDYGKILAKKQGIPLPKDTAKQIIEYLSNGKVNDSTATVSMLNGLSNVIKNNGLEKLYLRFVEKDTRKVLTKNDQKGKCKWVVAVVKP